MEYKFFDTTPECVTAEWYAGRAAAPHLEQIPHQNRMYKSRDFVQLAYDDFGIKSVVDLGCGDGGMLSLLSDLPIKAWGYDLQPTNIDHAIKERKVDARYGNFLTDNIDYADLAICTEVIEHLEDPHGFLKDLSTKVKFLIASSPNDETDIYHYEFHLWGWDMEGYTNLIQNAGFQVMESVNLSPFQVYLARS